MSSVAALRAGATCENDDPRYAWVMLPVAMMMHIGTSPGQTFGVSVFNEPIRESLGLSHSLLTGAYLVASLLAAVPMMTIGRRMDRHGLKRVSLVLVAMVGLACMVVAAAGNLVMLAAGFFMLRAFGQGGLSLAAGNTLGMWFHRRLGLASGIAGVGMSVAIAVTPLAYLQLIEWLGWRTAYLAIGLATWVVLLPVLTLLYRNNDLNAEESSTSQLAIRPTRIQPQYELRAAMRTPAYWVTATCVALMGMICTAVFFNLVPMFNQLGFTAMQAATLFPTVAIAMATMQMHGGLLADRISLGWLLAAAMTALAAGIVVLGTANTLQSAHFAAALIGGGQGLLTVSNNTLWPRYFGRTHLGAIRSSVWTATVAACSAGPFVMGVTLDLTGHYGPALWLFVSLALAAAVAAAIWVAPPGSHLNDKPIVEVA